ncbi:glycosyltransferase [Myxococcota bacterium]
MTFPKQIDLLQPGGPSRVWYDVMDQYAGFFDRFQGATLNRMHEQLLARADLVTTSSHGLARLCRERAPVEPIVVENGVPGGFVTACQQAQIPSELVDLPRPRLGYVGTISWWLDFDLVRSLALAFPHGRIIMVGRCDTRIPSLPPNVVFLGERRHAELPGLLAGLDLGLVPFVKTPAIDQVNPIKVYEYLAAGLPVLATEFEEMKRFAPSVTARAAEDWPTAARDLLGSPVDRQQQQSSVEHATWESRIERVANLMGLL